MKFGEAVTMIADRYGWNAFDNLNAINDPELVTAVEAVRTVRKKDPVRSTGPGADLRRTRPPRKELEKMVDKGMTYAEIGEAIGSTPETASKTVRVYGLSDRYWLMHGRYNLIKSEPYLKLVEQKKAELKSLIDHGATDVAIGAELGMTVGRVKYWIKEWNLGRKNRIIAVSKLTGQRLEFGSHAEAQKWFGLKYGYLNAKFNLNHKQSAEIGEWVITRGKRHGKAKVCRESY